MDCHVYPAEYDNPIEVREYTVALRLRFDIDDNYHMHQKIEGLLLRHVTSDVGSYTYVLGRHEITAINVSNPITVFQFPHSWINDIQHLKPLPVGLMMVPANHPRITFIANRDSKIVIKHPEHGEVTITFDGYYMVTVETESKASTFVGLMNEIAIDRIKQLSKQGGDNQ